MLAQADIPLIEDDIYGDLARQKSTAKLMNLVVVIKDFAGLEYGSFGNFNSAING